MQTIQDHFLSNYLRAHQKKVYGRDLSPSIRFGKYLNDDQQIIQPIFQ